MINIPKRETRKTIPFPMALMKNKIPKNKPKQEVRALCSENFKTPKKLKKTLEHKNFCVQVLAGLI